MSWSMAIGLIIVALGLWDAGRSFRRWWNSEAQRQRRAMAGVDPYIEAIHDRARRHPSEAAWDAQFEGDEE